MEQTLSAQPRPSPPIRQSRRRRRQSTAVLFVPLVVAQIVTLSVLTHRSWFFVDDFLFLAQGREKRWSLSFLRLPLFEHFSPVHRVLDLAFVRLFGLDWLAAHVILLALAASCIVAFALVARALLASRALALGLTAAYGTSLVFVRNVAWWTGGIHLFTATAFSLLTVLGYIRWFDTGERRWAAFSLAAYGLALLCHEQAMLVPVFVLLLRVLVLSGWRIRRLLDEWRLWLGYGALTLLSVANFLATYYHPAGRPSPLQIVKFLLISLFEGFLPSAFGMKVPEAPMLSNEVSVVLAAVLAATVILISLRRSPRAVRAWAFFCCSFLVAVLPLGLGRIAISGAEVGRELRYMTAPAFLGLLAVGAAFDNRFAPATKRASAAATSGRLHRALAFCLVALYLFLYVRDGARLQRSLWEPVAAKRYFVTFERDVALIRSRGDEPVIVPGTVPECAVPAWLFPFNTYEHALVLMDPELHTSGKGPRYTVDAEGHLRPVGGGGPAAGTTP
jgi:hypothetical protein